MSSSDLIQLLETAVQKRQPLFSFTNAVRLVNGQGDGMDGLVLEQYQRHFVAQVFTPEWVAREQELVRFLKERFQAEYFIVKERVDSASSDPSAITAKVLISHAPSKTEVHENGLKFSVDLNDTLNTGLFLDMRRNRDVVAGLAKGRKVLNCFAYTCSFGVYCRAQGAAGVVNVDVSRKILERGRENYQLNGIVPEKNEFIRANAVEYLERAVKKENRFDLIILDPPSFARHEGKVFSVRKDMPRLIDMACGVLNPGGTLFVSTNYSMMSHHGLEAMAESSLGADRVQSMEHCGQDKDFPASGFTQESYLAAVLVRTAG